MNISSCIATICFEQENSFIQIFVGLALVSLHVWPAWVGSLHIRSYIHHSCLTIAVLGGNGTIVTDGRSSKTFVLRCKIFKVVCVELVGINCTCWCQRNQEARSHIELFWTADNNNNNKPTFQMWRKSSSWMRGPTTRPRCANQYDWWWKVKLVSDLPAIKSFS